ncbi:hypothetical protein F5148DRAFT_110228 [Russula earlei]|uniref:Uncharacterized protein n=1 Tax=Russula earlei TaxID=71964 RepID=A0ACC0U8F4_9AGAM|nr:hypothetical protein F5148DRAFT_110228 [Russula earlei]
MVCMTSQWEWRIRYIFCIQRRLTQGCACPVHDPVLPSSKPLPLPAAGKLDLRCHCDKQFCKDHIHLPGRPSTSRRPLSSAKRMRRHRFSSPKRRAFVACNKPSLDAYFDDSARKQSRASALCRRSKFAYCASHRDASQTRVSGA